MSRKAATTGSRDFPSQAPSTLDVAVGICVYNEEKNIGQLLQLLAAVPFIRRIVVVSSGSTDETNLIVNQRASIDPRISLIVQPTRLGKAKAVNSVIQACRSDILVFIAGDTLPVAESVASLVKWFKDPRVGAVSARPVPVNPKKGFGYVAHIMWSAHWHYLWYLMQSGKLAHVSGEMCAFLSNLLMPIPNDIINEDAYLARLAGRTGFRILLDPAAIVHIKAPTNASELIDQRRRVLAGHKQVLRRTGHFPTVLATSWWLFPFASFRTLQAVFREVGLKTYVWGFVLLLCELTAGVLASRIFGGKLHLPWKPIASTKNLAQ